MRDALEASVSEMGAVGAICRFFLMAEQWRRVAMSLKDAQPGSKEAIDRDNALKIALELYESCYVLEDVDQADVAKAAELVQMAQVLR